MFKNVSIALLATLVSVAPVNAATDDKTVTIVLDQRDECGIGRYAYGARDKSKRKAQALKRELKAEGKSVRIVTLEPGTSLSADSSYIVRNPAC